MTTGAEVIALAADAQARGEAAAAAADAWGEAMQSSIAGSQTAVDPVPERPDVTAVQWTGTSTTSPAVTPPQGHSANVDKPLDKRGPALQSVVDARLGRRPDPSPATPAISSPLDCLAAGRGDPPHQSRRPLRRDRVRVKLIYVQRVHTRRRRHPDFPEAIAKLRQALVWAWPDVEA